MKYYDELAPGYEELHGEEQRRKLEQIAAMIKAKPAERLLDVGCGTGIAEEFFSCNYTGLDPAENLLKKVKGKAVKGVAEDLPFNSSEFDIVICVSALHNFDNPEKAVKEIKRVGKDRFAITVFRKGKNEEKKKLLMDLIEKHFDTQAIIKNPHDFLLFCK